MNANPEVAVTVSAELWRHLRKESRRLNVPLEWLIAALVADTIDGAGAPEV
jgi:hypothetical protein